MASSVSGRSLFPHQTCYKSIAHFLIWQMTLSHSTGCFYHHGGAGCGTAQTKPTGAQQFVTLHTARYQVKYQIEPEDYEERIQVAAEQLKDAAASWYNMFEDVETI